MTDQDSTLSGKEQRYEYRATGATTSGWKRTAWKDREHALSDYEEVAEEWDVLVAFERRVVGDDSTIQRKQNPESEEWMDVTTENIHFEDEDVMPA